jgi:hypothetical protein
MHAIAGEYQNMGPASGKGMRTTCDISEEVEGKTYATLTLESNPRAIRAWPAVCPAWRIVVAFQCFGCCLGIDVLPLRPIEVLDELRLPLRRYLAVAAQRCQLQQHRHRGENQRVARSAAMLIVFATTKRQPGTSTTVWR